LAARVHLNKMVDFKFETEGRQVVEAFAERVKGKTSKLLPCPC